MSEPKLCKDCRYSEPEKGSEWVLRCFMPQVIVNDSWALSSTAKQGPLGSGVTCHMERDRKWPAPCGKRGAMWTSK